MKRLCYLRDAEVQTRLKLCIPPKSLSLPLCLELFLLSGTRLDDLDPGVNCATHTTNILAHFDAVKTDAFPLQHRAATTGGNMTVWSPVKKYPYTHWESQTQ